MEVAAAQSLSREEVVAELRAMLLAKYAPGAMIDETTSLYEDGLFLDSDDVYEFLEDVHEKFGTDFTMLEFHDYFPPAAEARGEWLVRLAEKIFRFKTSRKKIMTVGHLADVVRKGVWFELQAPSTP